VPARLFHEAIASGEPARWLVFTHGICGSGGNWRTIARKVVARRPEWGVQLVDLRQHGRSEPGEPPQTIAACADDLRALIAELSNVDALAGHSFGGKVVLATRALVPVVQTWTFDSAPGPRTPDTTNDTVLRLLAFVDHSGPRWQRREDFVAALVADGHAPSLAQWFAMNLVPADGGGFVVRLHTDAIRALLADYGRVDLWPTVLDSTRGAVELVRASRSTTYTDGELAKPLPPHVHASVVDGGHWLNVDNPTAVVELIAERLPA
jgi:pimeloyl-ACP methyl ester carboxylesterase